MKADEDSNDSHAGSKGSLLRRKIEHLHRFQNARHLQRAQFGERGFLRPQVLELFEQQPMNGVDIMNRLQEMSRGWYRPSPGSIYPLLDQLEREGIIAKNQEGKYELTQEFGRTPAGADDMERAISTIESNVSYLEDLQRADAARLSRYPERIDRLAKRMDDLRGALKAGSDRR